MKSLASGKGLLGEVLRLLRENKWWWLTPMILILLLFGGLVIFPESSALAPFIYTLF